MLLANLFKRNFGAKDDWLFMFIDGVGKLYIDVVLTLALRTYQMRGELFESLGYYFPTVSLLFSNCCSDFDITATHNDLNFFRILFNFDLFRKYIVVKRLDHKRKMK